MRLSPTTALRHRESGNYQSFSAFLISYSNPELQIFFYYYGELSQLFILLPKRITEFYDDICCKSHSLIQVVQIQKSRLNCFPATKIASRLKLLMKFCF